MKNLLLVTFISISTSLQAKITLPSIFADHMVLQQQSEVSIWGWADPREEITIIANWDGQVVKTAGDNYANWKASLKTPKAGGPFSITIIGQNTIVLEDVLIGEVWICSGQSNMEWSVRHAIKNGEEEAMMANYPAIRLFEVSKRAAEVPQQDVGGKWEACSPTTMPDFSAVAYFFGRHLFNELKVPIGLIHSSWGGTPVEAWMNPKVLEGNERLLASAAKIPVMPWCPEKLGSTYNSMIAPLIPFAIKGAIWYQGETNVANHEEYAELFSKMIGNWREEWDNEFPFYYVQIAPYNYGTEDVGVYIREAQMQSMSVPNTGMVVISDIGNIKDIHPLNKQDVGKRLGNWALAKTYGKTGITYSGPIYKSMKIERGKIRISFDYADSGLMVKDGPLTHFTIAGEDQKFVEAQAEIEGNDVLVSAPGVKRPKAVRFGWSNTAEPNLFNQAGLPASAFRTDDWD